jgi:polyisoprenoid-binding protein YceI
MPIEAGTHRLGPENGSLTVETKRIGAASKAGHDLVIEVTSWEGTLDIGEESEVALTADSGSFSVLKGTGGIKSLDAEDMAGIKQTIDEEVLMRASIEFRSSKVELSDDRTSGKVDGELELAGRRHQISFELRSPEDGRLTGRAVVKQTDFGMKPYTALFGTLKVADEVEVAIDARLPAA